MVGGGDRSGSRLGGSADCIIGNGSVRNRRGGFMDWEEGDGVYQEFIFKTDE